MKIAIHRSSGSFSDRWIAYCDQHSIDYKIVDGHDSDIINQVEDCDILMWHHHHGNYKDILAAKNILFALEHAGKIVFPNFKTGWHFDNKVAQKYLLESVGAPLVPSYIFYDKPTALAWARKTSYPKVFKLKGGAGSSNVSLVKSKAEAFNKINKAFGRGFSPFDRIGHLKERYRKYREGKDNFLGILKAIGHLFIETPLAKMVGRDKGYAYFQEFIPKNDYDIRVIVIGSRAFAIKRMVREDDFRASGSGKIIYDRNQIDIRCVQLAFRANEKIQSQAIAYDFVFDFGGNPLIVEISYGFLTSGYDACEGYWDNTLAWHATQFDPQGWMIELCREQVLQQR